MLNFTLLCFQLHWMLPVDHMLFTCSSTAIQLNMAEESVDDMYDGCRDSTRTILEQNFSREKKGLWNKTARCAKENLTEISPKDKALTKDHLQAICVYTSIFCYQLNKDTREEKNTYGGPFRFHTLHFYLTTALQILNPYKQCYTTFRRTRSKFEGQVGQMIRFGSFASSSTRFDLDLFGSETCFIIETCLGAYVKKYSVFSYENEVLIPPYEMFTINEMIPKYIAPVGLRDCNVVYVLKHSGFKSNLNCTLVEKFQWSATST